MSDAVDAKLRRAAELFDAAEYHAAHEVLDELWETASREDSDFLKGLIQACVALHHFKNGNPDGARKLYSGHRQYLGPYLPGHRGLDLAKFLGAMQTTLTPLVRARAGEEPEFELELRPRMEFSK